MMMMMMVMMMMMMIIIIIINSHCPKQTLLNYIQLYCMGSGSRLSVNRLNDLNLSEVAIGTDFFTFYSFSNGLSEDRKFSYFGPFGKTMTRTCCLSPVH